MIKIYSSRERELEVIDFLAEFRVRAFTTYPIKGRTRKVRGTKLYKVINFPL